MGAGAGFAWRNVGAAVPEGADLDLYAIRRSSLRLTAAAGPQFAQADGVSAVAVATGLLLGLVARARGAGAPVLMTTMLSSSAHALSEDMVEYDGRGALAVPDPDYFGLGPLYRLYQAAEGWVFLAAPSEGEWSVLVAALGSPGELAAERFASPAGRLQHGDALAEALGAIFVTRPAEEWEAELVAAGIGCVAVAPAPPEGNYLGDLGRDNGYVAEVDDPTFGHHPRLAPLVRFSRSSVIARPSCRLGQHTAAVLAELGYRPERIEALQETGVVLVGG